ncbi:MAG: universal stress protein [Acidimicrobiales bacterium]|nr:universal stress protein [Acidimicrobiales bacterium]RZV46940.1 MAG: universal stress protein [Acidimicrobiales bacterium]
MGRIIVGLDGSMAARFAFQEAVQEAEWRNAKITAMHVVVVPVAAGRDLEKHDLERLQEYGETILDRELAEIASQYENGLPVQVDRLATVGHPGERIIDEAERSEDPAELVVLGGRGLGGFKGLLLGSVTTYAVHHMPSELLVVPAPEEASVSG